jgi:hypothetical protein
MIRPYGTRRTELPARIADEEVRLGVSEGDAQ